MSVNALEAAIASASAHYFKVGRAELRKQHTPRVHAGTFSGRAPLDYRGWFRDGSAVGDLAHPVVVECKECDEASIPFNDRYIKQPQLEAIAAQLARNVTSWLIVDMTAYGEVYRVDGRDLLAFTAAPWRSSLSIAWLRAHGFICKDSDCGDAKRRAVWWLDASEHPERATAYLAVTQEKAEAEGRVVELYPASGLNHGRKAETFRDILARKPGHAASDVEIIAWRNEFSAWELERSIAEAKRQQSRAPARRKNARKGWAR